jgi:enoyl-CoA hydratase/carnithine racemase
MALVTHESDGTVATITMDDGKVNVLSLQMLMEVNAALDRATADRQVVVLTGREGIFSAGFDLTVLRGGTYEAIEMLRAGFELAERLLAFPTPVVVAVPGHAIAMGLFLALAGDFRVGARGPFRLTANEVAIGMTLPHAALEILRHGVAPSHFTRVVLLAEPFTPDDAVGAGMLSTVVEPAALLDTARTTAAAAAALDLDAHVATKRRARADTLRALRAAIETDFSDLRPLA